MHKPLADLLFQKKTIKNVKYPLTNIKYAITIPVNLYSFLSLIFSLSLSVCLSVCLSVSVSVSVSLCLSHILSSYSVSLSVSVSVSVSLYIYITLFESLKVVLISMVAILAKLATLGLLKIKVF